MAESSTPTPTPAKKPASRSKSSGTATKKNRPKPPKAQTEAPAKTQSAAASATMWDDFAGFQRTWNRWGAKHADRTQRDTTVSEIEAYFYGLEATNRGRVKANAAGA